MRCTICNSEVRFNHNAFRDAERPTCSPRCEKRRQALARMVGLIYWIDRNGRGWGRVKPYTVDGSLLRVEDCETLDRYPVDPKDLKTEFSLTRKQRIACGLPVPSYKKV